MATENSVSKRLEIFRQKRIRRKRCIAALLLLTVLLAAGIIIVDKSVNSLVSGQQAFSLLDFKNHGANVEITIMNNKVLINIENLRQYLERLKNIFHETLIKKRDNSSESG